jgi:4-diphosphocytidyl-2-C-methyl-D-erythritol kinase
VSESAIAMDALVVAAPAKVNLFLHVVGRRADGFHLIESLFARVDLADTVRLARIADDGVVRTRELPGVSEDDDLSIRAARALKVASGTRAGVAIAVEKRIPQGGGLGGGSSDAASVLLALNRLWGLRWPRERLAVLGATLGADVPFFVHGENAFVRGVGERVTPVSLPAAWLALAHPPVHVPTAEIFAAPDLTRSTPSAKISVFSEGYGRNDLAGPACAKYPSVAAAIAALAKASRFARMTGSGARAFAAFATEREARDAVASLPAGVAGHVVRTLARHPLASFA